MGTVLNLTVYGADRDSCEEALNQTIATMKALEGKLSRHMPDSELSRLNQDRSPCTTERGSPIKVLAMANDLSRKSSGAFDVTILPLSPSPRKNPRDKRSS